VADSANSFLPRTLRTVFLDRDGVLNRKMPEGRYVTSWSEFLPLPGVPQAIGRLNRAGLRVIVVSNQRGIALGLYTSDIVRKLHAALQSWLQSQVPTSTPSSSALTTSCNATAASRSPASSIRPAPCFRRSPPNPAS